MNRVLFTSECAAKEDEDLKQVLDLLGYSEEEALLAYRKLVANLNHSDSFEVTKSRVSKLLPKREVVTL